MFSTRVSVCRDLCTREGLLPSLSAHFLFGRGGGVMPTFSLVLWQTLNCFAAHPCPSCWAPWKAVDLAPHCWKTARLLLSSSEGWVLSPWGARGGRDPGELLRDRTCSFQRSPDPDRSTEAHVTSQGNA